MKFNFYLRFLFTFLFVITLIGCQEPIEDSQIQASMEWMENLLNKHNQTIEALAEKGLLSTLGSKELNSNPILLSPKQKVIFSVVNRSTMKLAREIIMGKEGNQVSEEELKLWLPDLEEPTIMMIPKVGKL